MNQEELTVQVVDRRLQVNMDEQYGPGSKEGKNEFLGDVGYEARDKHEE